MSTKVVRSVHGPTVEDYTWVPTCEELDAVSDSVKAVQRSVSSCESSIGAFERKIASCEKRVVTMRDEAKLMASSVNKMKEDIAKELREGSWRDIVQSVIKKATEGFEEKVRESGKASAEKISELVKHEVEIRAIVEKVERLRTSLLEDLKKEEASVKKGISLSVTEIQTKLNDKMMEISSFMSKVSQSASSFEKLSEENLKLSSELSAQVELMRKVREEANDALATVLDKSDQVQRMFEEKKECFARLCSAEKRFAILFGLSVAASVLAVVLSLVI